MGETIANPYVLRLYFKANVPYDEAVEITESYGLRNHTSKELYERRIEEIMNKRRRELVVHIPNGSNVQEVKERLSKNLDDKLVEVCYDFCKGF